MRSRYILIFFQKLCMDRKCVVLGSIGVAWFNNGKFRYLLNHLTVTTIVFTERSSSLVGRATTNRFQSYLKSRKTFLWMTVCLHQPAVFPVAAFSKETNSAFLCLFAVISCTLLAWSVRELALSLLSICKSIAAVLLPLSKTSQITKILKTKMPDCEMEMMKWTASKSSFVSLRSG